MHLKIMSTTERDILKLSQHWFTGMAPIPYTVYAGTFLEAAKIEQYFEYNAHDGKYYSLKSRKKGANIINLSKENPYVLSNFGNFFYTFRFLPPYCLLFSLNLITFIVRTL